MNWLDSNSFIKLQKYDLKKKTILSNERSFGVLGFWGFGVLGGRCFRAKYLPEY